MKCLIKSADVKLTGDGKEESRSRVLGADELFMIITKNSREKGLGKYCVRNQQAGIS